MGKWITISKNGVDEIVKRPNWFREGVNWYILQVFVAIIIWMSWIAKLLGIDTEGNDG